MTQSVTSVVFWKQGLIAAAVSLSAFGLTRFFAADSNTDTIPWCTPEESASSSVAVDMDWLLSMRDAGASDNRPPARLRLSELPEEQWQDFRDALAVFRAYDAEQPYPEMGFFALTARHGVPDEHRSHVVNVPERNSACFCNHSAGDGDPGDPNYQQPLFLLWHRAYIHAFELSIRSIMRSGLPRATDEYGNPRERHWRTFRLPYWDWSADSDDVRKRELDVIFQRFLAEPCSTSGGKSAPFCGKRSAYFLRDGHNGKDDVVGIKTDLKNPFLGEEACDFDTFSQALDSGWHGSVHGVVGGVAGEMTVPATAAQDPLFWVHHANVDRLWLAWWKGRRINCPAPTNELPPDLASAWYSKHYVFPVWVEGQPRAYWPTYDELTDNAGTGRLGYRYSHPFDYFKGQPTKEIWLDTLQKLEPITLCPNYDRSRECAPREGGHTVVIGRAADISVSSAGVLLRLDPGASYRDTLRAVIGSDLHSESSLFHSIFVSLKLADGAVQDFRKKFGDVVTSFSVYLVALSGDEEAASQQSITYRHLLGTLDLFDTERFRNEQNASGWQNFAVRNTEAGRSIAAFLQEHDENDWKLAIAVIPAMRGTAVPAPNEVLIKIDKLGIAGRGVAVKCPQYDDMCPLVSAPVISAVQ